MTNAFIDAFITQHHLPEHYREAIEKHLIPLSTELVSQKSKNQPLVVGISGSQGSGKSTLAKVLSLLLNDSGYRCATVSIDDIYLTKSDRLRVAKNIHPPSKTRRVPGTHDVKLGIDTINQLKTLTKNKTASIVRFDKSIDDRAPKQQWENIQGPIDFILLEGWCVAAKSMSDKMLITPVNDIEKNEDPKLVWRRHINQQLTENYSALFKLIDYLVFIQIPNFDLVLEWRYKQEQKMEQATGKKGMSKAAVQRFILLDQRITLDNLTTLPLEANALITLNDQHQITSLQFKGGN